MAIWYAQANSSNINGLNLWSSLPAGGSGFLTWANLSASDILIANAKTGISCNVGFTCATISTLGNFGGGTGTNGGNFTLPDSITIACNVVAGTSTCVTRVTSGGASTVTGNITGSAATATQYGFSSPGAGQTNITGNITGGAAANAAGILTASSGSVVVTGNVIGGTASYGISASGTGSVTVSGTVSGHATGNLAGGITASGTVTISVSGNVTAGANSNGIYSTSTAYTLFTAASTWTPSSVGYAAVVCIKPLIPSSGTVTHAYYTNNSGVPGTARSLYTGGLALGHPATANVRSGTVYGSTSEYTGTLLVPNPAYVSAGVGTDNTVGTLITYLNNPTIVSRSTNDANPITFSWPVSGATITGTVSLNTANYVNVTGAISYSRTEGSKYYYKIAHNSADRTTAEGTARYAFTDGTYTRYATLRITGSSSQSSLNTLDDYVDTEVAAIKAKTDQLTFTVANQIDANSLTIGANAITASALATDAVNEIVDQVWDELLSGHTGAGSTGAGLSAAGAAGDPWSTLIPGSYGAGTAGKIVGDNVNATISSRASQTSLDTLDDLVDTEVAAIKTKTDQLTFTIANQIDSNSLTIGANVITASALATDAVNEIQSGLATPTNITAITGNITGNLSGSVGSVTGNVGGNVAGSVASVVGNVSGSVASVAGAVGSVTGAVTVGTINADVVTASALAASAVNEIADQVWDELLSGHAGAGSTGAALSAAGSAGDPWSTALPGAYGAGTAGKIVGDNVNATISSRASQTSLDTLDDLVDTEVAAIKTKTDQLVFTVANQVDSNSLSVSATGIRTAVGLATANLDTQIAAVPTAAQNFAAVLTTALTESYAADNVAPTLAQAIMLIQQSLHEFAISSTTRTVKKLDGSTTAATFTLDSATAPTSTTRAT